MRHNYCRTGLIKVLCRLVIPTRAYNSVDLVKIHQRPSASYNNTRLASRLKVSLGCGLVKRDWFLISEDSLCGCTGQRPAVGGGGKSFSVLDAIGVGWSGDTPAHTRWQVGHGTTVIATSAADDMYSRRLPYRHCALAACFVKAQHAEV